MPYEQGMQIDYDEKSGQVTVTFRGERATLPTQYRTKTSAVAAAEEYCRRHGWSK